MMLKMIFNQTSVEHCKTHTEKLKECNFFLIAVRLASLNQILDPWVYLLLRKILLRKFCQVANAVSSCSNDGQKGQPISLSNEIIQTGAWKRTPNQLACSQLLAKSSHKPYCEFRHLWHATVYALKENFDIRLNGLRSIDNPLCAKSIETQTKENILLTV